MTAPAEAKEPYRLVEDLISQLVVSADLLDIDEEGLARLRVYEYGHLISSEEWTKLQPLLNEEFKRRTFEFSRKQFQQVIRRRIAEEWIDQNVRGLSQHEPNRLANTIDLLSSDDQYPRLEEYLNDVLTLGLKKADRKSHRRWWRETGFVGHVWEALKGVARVVIVWGALSACTTKFETIVVALLALIYNAIYSVSSAENTLSIGRTVELREHFRRIRRVLGRDLPHENKDEEYEKEKAFAKDANNQIIRFYVKGVFDLLVWVIAILKLIYAL